MNKSRRKSLDEAAELLGAAQEIIESCGDDEQAYFDSMPEGLWQSEKALLAEDTAAELEQITLELEEVINRICGCML